MDGKTHQLDDSSFLVYDGGGVPLLCELWDVCLQRLRWGPVT